MSKNDVKGYVNLFSYLGHKIEFGNAHFSGKSKNDKIKMNLDSVSLSDLFVSTSPGYFFEKCVPVKPLYIKEVVIQGSKGETGDVDLDVHRLKPYIFKTWIHYFNEVKDGKSQESWKNELKRFCSKFDTTMKLLEKQLKEKGYQADYQTYRLNGRCVVGLGSASFWETGMIFHKPSGLPYIPSSSLKGLTRAVAFEHAAWERIDEITKNEILNENNYEKRLEIIQNKVFKPAKDTIENWFSRSNLSNNTFLENLRNLWENLRGTEKTLFTIGMLFGTQGYAGRLVFVDAFPAEPPTFDLDIMNVHYPDYYSNPNKKYALDVENPNPITFLVVKDTPFHFLIALRPAPGMTNQEEDKELLKKAWNWLRKGLSEYGVGAKTRLGYGIFHTQEDMKP